MVTVPEVGYMGECALFITITVECVRRMGGSCVNKIKHKTIFTKVYRHFLVIIKINSTTIVCLILIFTFQNKNAYFVYLFTS